jgi:hypothetical protein
MGRGLLQGSPAGHSRFSGGGVVMSKWTQMTGVIYFETKTIEEEDHTEFARRCRKALKESKPPQGSEGAFHSKSFHPFYNGYWEDEGGSSSWIGSVTITASIRDYGSEQDVTELGGWLRRFLTLMMENYYVRNGVMRVEIEGLKTHYWDLGTIFEDTQIYVNIKELGGGRCPIPGEK